MNNDEFKDSRRMDFPEIKGDYKKTMELFESRKSSSKKKIMNLIKLSVYTLVICVISVFSTILISRLGETRKPGVALNVDMGKNPYLSRVGYSDELYNRRKAEDPNWEPIFDNLIAFGPESASGTIKLGVINKSHLLSDESKQILAEYETSIKKTYPSHTISFQIAFGIKNNKDYIYLIDYCGYDNSLKKEVWNEFLFESNLNYSFESIVNEFELQIGKELTDEYLNSSYYDDQNLLSSGIIIGFTEVDGRYQEYYMVKLDGELFVISK